MRYEASVLRADGTQERATLVWDRCVAVSHAGRDRKSVLARVGELEKLGFPRPYAVPALYWIDPERVLARTGLFAVGGEAAGEAGIFLARDEPGDLYVAPAAGLADRALERTSASKAGQVCGRAVAPCFWKVADVREHWDEIRLFAEIPDGEGGYRVCRSGTLGDLLTPERLWELALEDLPSAGRHGQAISLFSGPPEAGGGVCEPEFRLTLFDPALERRVRFGCTVERLPDRNGGAGSPG